MKQKLIKVVLVPILLLVLSCVGSNQSKSDSQTSEAKEVGLKTVNVEKRFVGAWKLIGMIPEISKNDHSMDGIICNMERYPNTEKTFVFHLFTGHDLILSIKDNNNLVGQNANMNIKYNEDTEELKLWIPKGSTWIFKKLD